MVKAYTGRQIPLNVAASEAQAVVAGELLEAGQISMGGPGQAYYDGAKVRVVETLSGDVKPEITIAYTRQTMPEQAAEAEPQIREVYLFFLTLRSDGTWRATKIDAASEQNKAAVKRLLGGPAPHR